MNVRKQRTHQCGLTNVDFRTKGDSNALDKFQPNMKYADAGTMGKASFRLNPAPESLQESVKQTGGWQGKTRLDPKTETQLQFYNAQGKKPKAPVLVANRKTQELEKEEWTDKVFTGDNPRTTATLA